MSNPFTLRLLTLSIVLTVSACGSSDGPRDNGVSTANPADLVPPNPSSDPSTDSRPTAIAPVNGFVLKRADIFDDSGQLAETRYLEYDFASNRISYISTPPNQPTERNTFIEFAYDERGNRTSRNLLSGSGNVQFQYETLFASDGYAVTESLYRSDGTLNSTETLEYNNLGQLIRTSTDPSITQGVIYTYDERGRIMSTTETFNSIDLSSTRRYQYLADSANVVKIEHFVDDANQPSYFYELEYDLNGNLVSLATQTDSGPGRRFAFTYEESPEPVFNYWLDHLRYYSHDFRNL